MADISVFSPSIDEKKWVSQGNRALSSSQLAIEIDFTPSIFQLPKAITEAKPESYTPQHIGLGAYHHLRPELHVTDMQKLAKVKTFLSSRNFSDDFLGKTRGLEPAVRASYDKYLDLECSTLDYIVAIDSLFLLDFLGSYDDKTKPENLEPGLREFAKDVAMVENQVPAFAVAEMGKELDLFSPEKGTPETMLYSQLFYYFCKAHSPLKLTELRKDRRTESKHLLAHMYYLIVNNHGRIEVEQESMLGSKANITEIGTEVLSALTDLGLGGPIVKSLQFTFKSLQVWENSKLAAELSKDQQQKANTNKIQIPSVSELSEKYKVEFKQVFFGGIRHIEFENEDEGKPTIYLPEITLKHDSEVVLRNLVAYEAAIATPESSLELAEYVDLMCGLVHTDKDVSLLREKGIVKSDLTRLNDEQVAEIFNGFSRSAGHLKESKSGEVVKQVKEMVEKWENKKAWKRLWRFLEKNVKNAVEFLRKPSAIAMKFALYIFMVLLLVLQIMQAYCQFYGCSKGESETKAFSLMMSG